MTKDSKVIMRSAAGGCKSATLSKLSSPEKAKEGVQEKKISKLSKRKEYGDSTCSVCMEFPHNAVLLLCSSYNKGCRPYMCATSCRFSNCLEQYKKAYTKVVSIEDAFQESMEEPDEKKELTELLCPLCRGQVKGWTVVDTARKYLNSKKRSCMQDKCSFVGNYKQLRKHVKTVHPLARPRQVDPTLKAKWTRLEHERERSDVISTIRSSMPGSIVVGDYVIEQGDYGGRYRGFGDLDSVVFNVGSRGAGRGFRLLDEEDNGTANNRNPRRLLYGAPRRRAEYADIARRRPVVRRAYR